MLLRRRFFLWISCLVTVAILLVGALMVVSERRLLVTEMEERHDRLVNRLALVCEESLYQNDLVFLNYIESIKTERAFVGAAFIDDKGLIRFHSDLNKIGGTMPAPAAGANTSLLDLAAPVLYAKEQVGTARLLFDRTVLKDHLTQATQQAIFRIATIAAIALFICFIGAWLLARSLVKPIHRLINGMKEISDGRREPIPFPERKDELGWMGMELNNTVAKLKEVDEIKRDFVAGVTHDLKSPLKAIQSIHSLLLTGDREYSWEKVQDYLLTGLNNSNRLMKFIDDLLLTARIEGKGEVLHGRLVDIRTIVKDVAHLFEPVSKEKKIKLQVNMPKESVYGWADPDKLSHVLTNLVSNAFKYTEKGSVTLECEDEEEAFLIRVRDTGAGIPKADQTRIFDKFHRSPANANLAKGTGLGLYISKGMVEAHGGTLTVTPNPGGGSLFTVTIPHKNNDSEEG